MAFRLRFSGLSAFCSTLYHLTVSSIVVQLSKKVLEITMDIVIDTSALIAVLVGEIERSNII